MRCCTIALLLLLAAIAGCGEPPPFDASSTASARMSIETIKSYLSAAEGADFEAAVMTIGLYNIDPSEVPQGEEIFDQLDYRSIDGLTYKEIIAKANKLPPKLPKKSAMRSNEISPELLDGFETPLLPDEPR